MKADIIIPKVENVFFAAVHEWNDDFLRKVWNVYLVNDSDFDLETIIVVTKAYGEINGEMKKSSTLRYLFQQLPSVSLIKVEMIEDSLLELDNELMLSYFIGNKLYDKKFIFPAFFPEKLPLEEVPILFEEGIIIR